MVACDTMQGWIQLRSDGGDSPHSLPLTIDCIDYVVYTIYALTLTIDL